MRALPFADPGIADHRSPTRYLLWVARGQWTTLLLAALWGSVWMAAQALMPAVVGRAVDAGLVRGSTRALLGWSGALLALGATTAIGGVLRHRMAIFNRQAALYRTVQVLGQHAARVGAALTDRIAAGEVVAVGTTDVSAIGAQMDVVGRAAGALVALAVVIAVLFAESVPLGAATLVGVPLVMAGTAALLRPMHHRQSEQRAAQGALAERAADIVSGLRVLRGIGGEQVFSARYREESARALAAGVEAARVESYLRAAQVLLPGLLVAAVTWLGAREAAAGRISIGHLVAFYAYAAFLIAPLWNLYDLADRSVRARVAARRIVRVLALQPRFAGRTEGELPPSGGELLDEESGLRVRAGRLTAVAAAVPEEAALIAERLGRWRPGRVRYAGRPLDALPQQWVRREILVAVNADTLFSGPLREELDPYGRGDEGALRAALEAASAADVVAALEGGLDAGIAERGREFSGGQLQRLRLARALMADPEVLVLVEPTSAVDAHTEARIAERLARARRGRTTVVVTTSPLLLDRADRVAYVAGGRVVAEGVHRRLLSASPAYARTVTRAIDPGPAHEEDPAAAAGAPDGAGNGKAVRSPDGELGGKAVPSPDGAAAGAGGGAGGADRTGAEPGRGRR